MKLLKLRILTLVTAAALSIPLVAESQIPAPVLQTSQTISGVTCTPYRYVLGLSVVKLEVDVTGTFSLQLEEAIKSSVGTYSVVPITDATDGTPTPALDISADGKYNASIGGATYIRVCGISGAGSALVSLGTSLAGGSSGAGGAGGGGPATTVDISQSGTDNNVDVITLPAIPTGTNSIGNIGTLGTITNALPSGTNVIGHIICDSGCAGSGGTASNFGAAFPTAGTAIGISNGTNMVSPAVGAGAAGVTVLRNVTATDSPEVTGLGAIGDAAIAVGATGSINAKLRLITSQLDAVQASLALLDNAISGAGINISQIGGTAPTGEITADFDSGGGTAIRSAIGLAAPASGGAVILPGDATRGLFTQSFPSASSLGGADTCYLTSTASTNATNCKGSPGTAYLISGINTTATLYYLRLYNLAASPTCSSATGFIESIPISADTAGAGFIRASTVGKNFSAGIGFCLTAGGSSTDNTNAATGVYINIEYK